MTEHVPDLLALTAAEAAKVHAGDYDHLLPSAWPAGERWAARLWGDDDVDVWLISWVPERSTELHDHAGSLGALTVVDGALAERSWDGEGLRERRIDPGGQAAFDRGWVHDVTRHPDAHDAASGEASSPTLSVHAYSPPLTAMSYYEVSPNGRLRRVRSELTDEPEAPPKTPAAKGINALLAAARDRIERVSAAEVADELAAGAHLVDIRPAAQRASEGEVPGALVIERNVLEWRLDPTSTARIDQAVDWDVRWLVICSEGYTSSLAAAALRDIGLHRAADVAGGYHALTAALVG
ncbi:Cysteine dioxygenase type I OS=Tsukamurella paurometabola (strain ATCC 8368 / DSM / CCUG 35730/ CIP 100753 / JCM 10117 / KCTC 9821 / NBRC 16120 / NCIMB 702349 / NCTC 13040) OX=521096 GN=Tpau_4148 PE=3 SV=1 [Tsukamurella paurometabola]|uniref:Cysteine dioxygenase type I n=1 Tax=Tsukamurella paurometabola (strain ATCC 8368 / DSM 20162 / CCUG 35730 / CIP 100753 / JCM 10117 / KCTC 9821 / NBRC 16120 / NCIMB 702349 / NCTC 13040) TaxID=521096 RepID=D5UP08_TSUPD|nr:cysteine dioxygenase type I [Tsukamurella paurometabola DSM 20162]SUP40687.1 molybdopterin biosynthesis protein MoeB [Tsukamurella paurometabola]